MLHKLRRRALMTRIKEMQQIHKVSSVGGQHVRVGFRGHPYTRTVLLRVSAAHGPEREDRLDITQCSTDLWAVREGRVPAVLVHTFAAAECRRRAEKNHGGGLCIALALTFSYVYGCFSAHLLICTSAHMLICTYADMYVCTYADMHVCTCACACTCAGAVGCRVLQREGDEVDGDGRALISLAR